MRICPAEIFGGSAFLLATRTCALTGSRERGNGGGIFVVRRLQPSQPTLLARISLETYLYAVREGAFLASLLVFMFIVSPFRPLAIGYSLLSHTL